MSSSLRLIVADPQQLFRECLCAALGRCGGSEPAGSAEGALALLAAREADVLIASLDLPGVLSLIREVAARFPRVKILVLGPESAAPAIVACLEAGACGYVLREQSIADLREAVAMALRGEAASVPAVNHLLFARVGELGRERRQRQRLELFDLTAREIEILALIAEGLSNQRIAERLCLSVHTVKNHVHNMLERLGLESRARAVEHAYERGWLARRPR